MCPATPRPESTLRPRASKFAQKIEKFSNGYNLLSDSHAKPRTTETYKMLYQCESYRKRSIFIRMATDTLLQTHMASKGYETGESTCRICPDGSRATETLRHLTTHLSIEPTSWAPLAPGLKRKLRGLCSAEEKQMKNPQKRIRLEMGPDIISLLLPCADSENFTRIPKFKKRSKISRRATKR